MRYTLTFLLMMVAATVARADELVWSRCVEYWYSQNVSTNVPPIDDIVSMTNVKGVQTITWKIPTPHPTKAELEALSDAANTWWQAREDDKDSPDKGWANLSRKERFLIRVMYRLAKELHPALTLEQFKTQIRTEWDETSP